MSAMTSSYDAGQMAALDDIERAARVAIEGLVERRDEIIRAKVQPLDVEIRRYEEQIKLLAELRASLGGEADTRSEVHLVRSVAEGGGPTGALEARRYNTGSVKERVVSRVEQI